MIMREDILRVAEYFKNTSNEQNVCAYRITDLLFHYEKILLFFSLKIHPALSVYPAVHKYIARVNEVCNRESQ